jgi:uncharacterized membrane protein required for colicin V production
MSSIDIFILVVTVGALFQGYRKGLIAQLGRLAGFILGTVACRLFSSHITDWLNGREEDLTASDMLLNSAIGYVSVFLVVYIASYMIFQMLHEVTHTLKLKAPEHVAGAIFKALEWLVGVSLVLNVWIAIFPDSKVADSNQNKISPSIMSLAPTILGSDTAKEIFDFTTNYGKSNTSEDSNVDDEEE